MRRLNARVLRLVDRRSGESAIVRVEVDGPDLLLEDRLGRQRRLGLDRIGRLVAVRAEVYAGLEDVLLIETTDAGVIPVPASTAGWPAMCALLDDRLPGALASREWTTRLASQPAGEPVEVWSRA